MDTFFVNAEPVWLAGREQERHLRVLFESVFHGVPGKKYVAKIATSGIYHLRINGKFAAYGPARAGRAHFRVDQIDISPFVTDGDNRIVIEVAGYFSTSFYLMEQSSFVQAEVFADGCSVCASGRDFTARVNPNYVQKAERYSYQRPMLERYRYLGSDSPAQPICKSAPKKLLERRSGYPAYEILPSCEVEGGTLLHITPETLRRRREIANVDNVLLTGFLPEEIDYFVADLLQTLDVLPGDTKAGCLHADEYALYKLPHNASGMIRFHIDCQEDTQLLLSFDEILNDNNKLRPFRFCTNGILYDLKQGSYDLQTFEIYTMQFIQASVLKGSCTITAPEMVEYKHPPVNVPFKSDTPQMQQIIDAAVETYRQNAVDLFTDCPSRERAGWLCDSFFTARVEHLLTGQCGIETDFLENFLHEERFEALPEGMVPMCYPADHRNGRFIPNWAMWLVLELGEYRKRVGNNDLVARFESKIDGLLGYFRKFENSDGLLENLESWIFIEWSQANKLVQDVNYPSNMMYCKMLNVIAQLYDRPECAAKAERIRQQILKQSFNGQFFCDNAIRTDGKLVPSGECTEVCQYYAFFCGIVDRDSHPQLFETLLTDFGPERKITNKWPQIHFANVLPGMYLRLEILMQYGYKETVRDNIVGYFLYMAQRTGTLWEKDATTSSLNHGFTSHVLYWLKMMQE